MKIREKMTGLVMKDIATYLIFLLIVAKLAYSERDFHTYIYRKDMVNMLKDAKYTGGPQFEQVSLIYLLEELIFPVYHFERIKFETEK